MEHLEVALKTLKKNKSRDPNGWINELFQDGVAGKNLKLSLLHIVKRLRKKTIYQILSGWQIYQPFTKERDQRKN